MTLIPAFLATALLAVFTATGVTNTVASLLDCSRAVVVVSIWLVGLIAGGVAVHCYRVFGQHIPTCRPNDPAETGTLRGHHVLTPMMVCGVLLALISTAAMQGTISLEIALGSIGVAAAFAPLAVTNSAWPPELSTYTPVLEVPPEESSRRRTRKRITFHSQSPTRRTEQHSVTIPAGSASERGLPRDADAAEFVATVASAPIVQHCAAEIMRVAGARCELRRVAQLVLDLASTGIENDPTTSDELKHPGRTLAECRGTIADRTLLAAVLCRQLGLDSALLRPADDDRRDELLLGLDLGFRGRSGATSFNHQQTTWTCIGLHDLGSWQLVPAPDQAEVLELL